MNQNFSKYNQKLISNDEIEGKKEWMKLEWKNIYFLSCIIRDIQGIATQKMDEFISKNRSFSRDEIPFKMPNNQLVVDITDEYLIVEGVMQVGDRQR